jgi:hypothetical protein
MIDKEDELWRHLYELHKKIRDEKKREVGWKKGKYVYLLECIVVLSKILWCPWLPYS